MKTKERIERELRKRLEAHETPLRFSNSRRPGAYDLMLATPQVETLTAALLPWILEEIEEADTRARVDSGGLPRNA